MSFSERMGFIKPRDVIQKDSMDEDLRIALWNIFFNNCYYEFLTALKKTKDKKWIFFIKQIWCDLLKKPINTISSVPKSTFNTICKDFFDFEFYKVYDFIEFVALKIPGNNTLFINECNIVLKRELSAYRFINGILGPITNEEEIKEIEITLSNTDKFKYVSEHINKALELLSKKPTPDYANSIKESISAVEAACNVICNSKTATLGDALKQIEKQKLIELHPALKSGFEKIYGYTSDGDGIRHSLTDESTLSEEDARFMLVSCSAFTNYLIVKYNK